MSAAALRVYVGFDSREVDAYQAAVGSLLTRSSMPVCLTPLSCARLAAWGLLNRPTDRRGRIYDLVSNAPCSTEFALSRFLVPMLAQTGWALFMDCDVLVLDDIAALFAQADESKAVQVVKHPAAGGGSTTKMDGQPQVRYTRKNWSSVVLWNCDHPANRRLGLRDVNERTGLELHQFYWLGDSEIGELPARWNWLVGEQPKPEQPGIAHYTLGGPWLPDWRPAEHDDLWVSEFRRVCPTTSGPIGI